MKPEIDVILNYLRNPNAIISICVPWMIQRFELFFTQRHVLNAD